MLKCHEPAGVGKRAAPTLCAQNANCSAPALSRGFTLVECLVAIVVLALAAVAVSSSLLGGIAAQEDALRMTSATAAAESRVNELMATEYETLVAGTVTEAIGDMSLSTGSSPAGFQFMGRRSQVASLSLAIPGYSGLVISGYQIDVTVFDEWMGSERTLATVSTFRPHTMEDDDDASDAGGAG